ncbi:hypothetical protein ACHWQZ_G013274 [Mnemiopsis leidyi]
MSRMGKSGHDDGLLSSMASRLRKVEEELQNKSRQLEEKDAQLHQLRVRLREEQSNDKLVAHLRGQCQKAFKQIQEMEEFLADYGMIWVGNSESPENNLEEIEEEGEESVFVQSTWSQEESIGNAPPDYNKIVHNVHELNILAGDGVGLVEKGADGITRVVQPDPIPLTLYNNGIYMFQGPFRPLSDPSTRQLVQDLEDGYFPSELQARYPKGMVIKLTDLREKNYVDKRHQVSFPGKGKTLSEGAKELAAIRGYQENVETEDVATETGDVVQKPSVERFLNKLPANVIRDGKIIDIRESIGVLVGNSTGATNVEVAETAVVKKIQAGEGTSGKVSTLRVKLNGGSKTLIVKLQYSDTVSDLRDFIDQHKTGAYEIRTTFPNKIYRDFSESLEEAGLIPSATLHVRDL